MNIAVPGSNLETISRSTEESFSDGELSEGTGLKEVTFRVEVSSSLFGSKYLSISHLNF
jgi:hypothetical protein